MNIRIISMLALLTAHSAAWATVYVDKDAVGPLHDGEQWTTAYTSIQQGINDADVLNEEVWVAEGVYLESVTLKNGVAVYGGFAGGETSLSQRNYEDHSTIIDPNQTNRAVNGANNARLDGFTARNGRASYGAGITCYGTSPTIANCTIEKNTTTGYGGGFYISSYSNAQIINCRIRDNSAKDGGGAGVYVHSTPLFENCRISGNTGNWGAGILLADYTNATVRTCEITDNIGSQACFGAGIHLLHNTAIIQGNLIARNRGAIQGGGVYGYDTTATIEQNLILENEADTGGGIGMRYSSPMIKNNLIVRNKAGSGGGVESSDDSVLTLRYNTLVGNRATVTGGGLYLRTGGSEEVKNCIIASNTAPEGSGIYVSSGCSCTSSYNDIFANDLVGMPGPGDYCISADPSFLAPEVGEYHLRSGSPCIDAGANIPGINSDMDANPRPIDGNGDSLAIPDIGCYEYASGPLRVWFIGQAKALADGTSLRFLRKPVSASFDGFFYIQEPDRSSGIRVSGSATEGGTVDVERILSTVNSERSLGW